LAAVVMLAIALTFLEAILQAAALVAPPFIRAAAPRPEPAGAIKILVVGDSHAAGAGVPKEENLPSQLERLLAQRHPDRTFRVFNLGLPGVNSPWVANRLERNIRAYDPDVIISWVGVNDTWNATETDAWGHGSLGLGLHRLLLKSKVYRLAVVTWHTRGVDADQTSEQIHQASRHVAKPPRREIARGLSYDLERMAHTARTYGVPIIFMNYPVPYAGVNETIQKSANKLRVPVVDAIHDVMRARGEGHEQDQLLWYTAGPHPTGLLYRYVAESTVPTVERLLPDMKAGASARKTTAG
jgi:lysophospholipase L1-like esterase